ncbi:hypothetical protein BpHYR1_003844 [Brachionus plicatilis]|uniref:Uncharacterized protein n=1 Tax=Brachionus plicatilis TaxID=10195 RepID=A0A3M7RWY1_BRAPC|nr:hypothetical protein BpHYR1_003844 [Brachionus plicatilis]
MLQDSQIWDLPLAVKFEFPNYIGPQLNCILFLILIYINITSFNLGLVQEIFKILWSHIKKTLIKNSIISTNVSKLIPINRPRLPPMLPKSATGLTAAVSVVYVVAKSS